MLPSVHASSIRLATTEGGPLQHPDLRASAAEMR
jgi:hypothetical protein